MLRPNSHSPREDARASSAAPRENANIVLVLVVGFSIMSARTTTRTIFRRNMKTETLYKSLRLPNGADTKLVMLVLDGVGDIATSGTRFLTPLEAAKTPNFDALAKASAMGRMTPVAPGITPGSGPGHLGLFGYDPLEYEVGRGVIEALGLGLELKAGDVCARANFCTLDAKGIVTDRRAGRIATEVCEDLCALLKKRVSKLGDTE